MTARIETTLLQTGTAGERVHAQSYMERFRAPFSLRCGALLIDYILLAGIIAFSTLLARIGSHGAATASNAQTIGIIIAIIVAAINFIGLSALRGQTLGKWATGLCVRRTEGEPLSWERSLLRHLVLYPPAFIMLALALLVAGMLTAAGIAAGIFILTLGVGFLMASFNVHGRALHDVIADTIVVRAEVRRIRRTRY
jgi:uncharacterized RDD family membrane protein YckC